MIIDAHCHIGKDVVFDCENKKEDLLKAHRKNGIDGGIVQPFALRPYMEDTARAHDDVAAFCRENKNYWGMAVINPHFRWDEFEREAERCVKNLDFVGLKITPISHAVNPASKDALHVFEVARALNVPVMVHTGTGVPFSDPIRLVTAAESFPDVPLVIAHLGHGYFSAQAIHVAKMYDNVFVEPSGCPVEETLAAYKALGASKMMFSTDTLPLVPVEREIYRFILEDHPEDREQIYYKTAQAVFNLKIDQN